MLPTGRTSFRKLVSLLEGHYGSPAPSPLTDPLELILWENVAYLANDEARAGAFKRLKREVGVRPEKILAASKGILLNIARAGIVPETTVKKLRKIAQIAQDEFKGTLKPILKKPLAEAMKDLEKFPSIGAPAAEKILLFTRTHPILALDSNGLRVMLRLGFGQESKNYASSYRSVRHAIEPELPSDCEVLIGACKLLRRHGQELCRRSKPKCPVCPLKDDCVYFASLSPQ
jgi:endonuclease III